jgi:hypothetical protein
MYTPTLAVPPPLRGADAGSFAEHSIAHRLPHIAQRVLADNSLTSAMRHRIENVMAAIPYRTLEAFTNPEAPDMPRWQDYMQPSRGYGTTPTAACGRWGSVYRHVCGTGVYKCMPIPSGPLPCRCGRCQTTYERSLRRQMW